MNKEKCKHDLFLKEYYKVIDELKVDDKTKHWLGTELFVYLHGQKTYPDVSIDTCNCQVEELKTDKLDQVFEKQRELINLIQSKEKEFGRNMNRTGMIMGFIAAMHNELEELRDWFPWKPWKTYPPDFEIDEHEAKLEVIDLLFFLTECAIQVFDMDADEFFKLYLEKHKINIKRHEGG